MESHNFSMKIACPIHPTEFIQRVHTDIDVQKQLFCLECLLQHEDSSISSKLKTVPDLVNIAAEYYASNKQTITLSTQVPSEYLDLISQQGDKLEKLNQHIEEEKKRISNIFDTILQDTVQIISDKKNEYLHNLDQQLFNLRYWYIYFDKQIKKAYPSEEDIPFLYPTKDDLNDRLGKIMNLTQLLAFVRSLKEDLGEKKKSTESTQNLERKSHFDLVNLRKSLLEIQDFKPFYEKGDLEVSSLNTELQKSVTEFLAKNFSLKNSIGDVTLKNFGSNFVTPEEFQMVREWLQKDINSFEPELLYSAQRDGLKTKTFHKLCDGKNNTITFIKAEFKGLSKTNTIGGFLDQPWKSDANNPSIYSTKSFIFNTTLKVKCSIKNSSHAALGLPSCGPNFGGGDLVVLAQAHNNDSVIHPVSFEGTKRMIDDKGYKVGMAYFIPRDVEVYSFN